MGCKQQVKTKETITVATSRVYNLKMGLNINPGSTSWMEDKHLIIENVGTHFKKIDGEAS